MITTAINLIPLLLPSVCIILIATLYAILFKRKLHETFFLSISTIILVLFISGLLNFDGCLMVGYWSVIALSLVSLFVFIKAFIKNKKIIKDISLILGIVIFTIFLGIAIFLNYKRMFAIWDEFSHWGIVVKSMYSFDALGTYRESTIMIKAYFPGISLFQYFWARPFTQFTEFTAYIASNILFFSIISVFIKKFDLRNVLFILSALLIPLLMGATFYSTLYVDCIAGILLGSILLYYFYLGYEKTFFGILMISATIAILNLTKDIGLVFSCVAILIIFIDSILFKRELLKSYVLKGATLLQKIRRFIILISPALTILIIQLLWKLHLRVVNVGTVLVARPLNIPHLLTGNLLPYQIETLQLLKNALISQPISPLYFSFLQIALGVIVLAILFGITMKKRTASPKRLITALIGIVAGSIFNIGVLVILYVFIFSEYEAVGLASYSRYMFSYIMGIFFSLLIFLILDPSNKKDHFPKHKLINNALSITSTIIIFLLYYLLLNNVKNGIRADIINARQSANTTVAFRKPYNNILAWKDNITGEEKQTCIISEGDTGLDKLILIHTLYPTDLEWIKDYSVGLTPYYSPTDPWTVIITPEDWAKYILANYKFLYIFKYDEKFVDTYGYFFDNVQQYQLYKVTTDKLGNMKLVSLTK